MTEHHAFSSSSSSSSVLRCVLCVMCVWPVIKQASKQTREGEREGRGERRELNSYTRKFRKVFLATKRARMISEMQILYRVTLFENPRSVGHSFRASFGPQPRLDLSQLGQLFLPCSSGGSVEASSVGPKRKKAKKVK